MTIKRDSDSHAEAMKELFKSLRDERWAQPGSLKTKEAELRVKKQEDAFFQSLDKRSPTYNEPENTFLEELAKL